MLHSCNLPANESISRSDLLLQTLKKCRETAAVTADMKEKVKTGGRIIDIPLVNQTMKVMNTMN